MIHVRAEAERNTNSAADENKRAAGNCLSIERGEKMVELDQFKTQLAAFEKPFVEMRDSL